MDESISVNQGWIDMIAKTPGFDSSKEADKTSKTNKKPEEGSKTSGCCGGSGCSASSQSSAVKKSPSIQGVTTFSSSDMKPIKKTRILIKYDVGYNNNLYLRGKGANLSWDKGIALKNIKSDEWIWETDQSFTPGEFKVLINDKQYETGENHVLTCGANIQYTPNF